MLGDTDKLNVRTKMKLMKIKTLLGLTLPLALVSGCAHYQRQADIGYNQADFAPLTPTSDRPEARVYPGGTTETFAPPPGAPPADWNLAEEIRDLLTRDRSLANEPMGAIVRNGEVTLRGTAPTPGARDRLADAISRLPGVTKVNDQLEVKNIVPTWKQPIQNY